MSGNKPSVPKQPKVLNDYITQTTPLANDSTTAKLAALSLD